ncbi:hypothetical protein ACIGW1_07715 [Streptomyces sp. NPDC053780]
MSRQSARKAKAAAARGSAAAAGSPQPIAVADDEELTMGPVTP